MIPDWIIPGLSQEFLACVLSVLFMWKRNNYPVQALENPSLSTCFEGTAYPHHCLPHVFTAESEEGTSAHVEIVYRRIWENWISCLCGESQ